jgi:hypothetical protein
MRNSLVAERTPGLIANGFTPQPHLIFGAVAPAFQVIKRRL